VVVEELSSGSSEPPRWWPYRRHALVLVAIAALVGVAVLAVHAAAARRRQHALMVRQDRIDVSLSVSGGESGTSTGGQELTASIEVDVGNKGAYPVSVKRAELHLAGVAGVSWSAVQTRLGPGASTRLQVRYTVHCPDPSGPIRPGQLVVDVQSAAGRVHRLTQALLPTDGFDDPVIQQVRQTCGALLFGAAVTLETLRTAPGSATLLLQNRGRTPAQVREIGLDDLRFRVSASPPTPLTVAARGQLRLTLTFAVRSCHSAPPTDTAELAIRGSNGETGPGPGDAGYSDDAINRMLDALLKHTCRRV
jgi:hypothetical protein